MMPCHCADATMSLSLPISHQVLAWKAYSSTGCLHCVMWLLCKRCVHDSLMWCSTYGITAFPSFPSVFCVEDFISLCTESLQPFSLIWSLGRTLILTAWIVVISRYLGKMKNDEFRNDKCNKVTICLGFSWNNFVFTYHVLVAKNSFCVLKYHVIPPTQLTL